MRRFPAFASAMVFLCIAITARTLGQAPPLSSAGGTQDVAAVTATVVATGIPGAGAITQIGTFHQGGPFVERPLFAVETQSGHVLDPARLFVASTSNFGAPLARPDEAEGSILSIDVTGPPVAVPSGFASAGGQASAVDGHVILYAAQSPAFLNSVNGNTGAVTASLPSVSLPLGISLNNGFGRPWFANAPAGSDGDGTITVTDPNGAPLRGAPSAVAGGVFAGDLTNRNAASTHGLTAAALATGLTTKSPDATGRAVFLAALADGSVVQVHVQKGVDGLVAPGSFTAIPDISRERAESNDPAVVTRAGMLFNWVPHRNVFVSDPLADRILVFDLIDDGTLLQAVNARYITSPVLHAPTDLAPAVREAAARNFSSNTTLGGGSDLYVLNRGNNSIVRMTQTGRVVAVRHIQSSVEGFRLNGIAVSENARTIWLSATAPGGQGIVLQTSTFGAGALTTSLIDHAQNVGAHSAAEQGEDIFSHDLTPADGLGPLFNGSSCASCHNTPSAGGMGIDAGTFVTRIARIKGGLFEPLSSHGGPIARERSITEFGAPCGIPTGVPPQATLTIAPQRDDPSRYGPYRQRPFERHPRGTSGRAGGNTRPAEPACRWPRRSIRLEGPDANPRRVHGRGVARRDRRDESARRTRSRQRLRRGDHKAGSRWRRAHIARRVSQHDRSAATVHGDVELAGCLAIRLCGLRGVPQAVLPHPGEHSAKPRVPHGDSHRVLLFGSAAPRHGSGPRRRLRAGIRHRKRIPDGASVGSLGAPAFPP